jgi:hypothetical protein
MGQAGRTPSHIRDELAKGTRPFIFVEGTRPFTNMKGRVPFAVNDS